MLDTILSKRFHRKRLGVRKIGGIPLRIELQTITGGRIDGAASLAGEIDQTSYDHQTVRIGTVEVALQDVVSFTITAPAGLRPH